jgi:hypothetical protein
VCAERDPFFGWPKSFAGMDFCVARSTAYLGTGPCRDRLPIFIMSDSAALLDRFEYRLRYDGRWLQSNGDASGRQGQIGVH